jgi:hypothetical protein
MVRQRILIHSRIFSGRGSSSAVIDDSVRSMDNNYHNQSTHQKQQQASRRHMSIAKCRLVSVAFTFFAYLSVMWSGYDTSFSRRLRLLSKKSIIDAIETLILNNNITLDGMTMMGNITYDVDSDERIDIDIDIDYPSIHEKNNDALVRNDNPLPRSISDLSIAFSNNLNASHSKINPCYRMKNEADIRQCYASHGVKKFSDPRCQSIRTWNDVQHCLMRRYYYPNMTTNNSRIREVHIVGERNSGTKFVTQFLQQCYPKKSKIRVHRDFIRSKHFFQPIHNNADYTNSLIVVVVRDPIEWMAAMREFPYHSPSHLTGFRNSQIIPLPWQEFVNKTWTTEASRADRTLTTGNRTKIVCTQSFRFDEVKPCILRKDMITGPPWNVPLSRVRGYYPLYEQRRGKPYDHLLQMRSDKIVNWILQIPLLMKIGGFVVVRYEDILQRGNEYFLQQVNAIVNNKTIDSHQSLPKHCSILAPQPDRIGKRYVPSDFKDWINRNIDVETEQLIGYYQ